MRVTREQLRKRREAEIRQWREQGPAAWQELRRSAAAVAPELFKAVPACVCDTTILLETYSTEELRIIREFLCTASVRIDAMAQKANSRLDVDIASVEGGFVAAYLDHLDEELRYRELDDATFENE